MEDNLKSIHKLINLNVVDLDNIVEIIFNLGCFYLYKKRSYSDAYKYFNIGIKLVNSIGSGKLTQKEQIANLYIELATAKYYMGGCNEAEEILAYFQNIKAVISNFY